MKTKIQALQILNELGKNQTPFYFFCDFLGENWEIIPKDALNHDNIRFSFYDANQAKFDENLIFEKSPIAYFEYKKAFQNIQNEILLGNSYLTNLTFSTPIQTNLTLEEIFHFSIAKYKVLFKDKFICFSPETFIKIKDNFISSFPMKGTINAKVKNAEKVILGDEKERAEHATIVDLIRNDLSQIADDVHVPKYRYIEKIKTHSDEILQVSSEVKGILPVDWNTQIGSILQKLLPAGSISGAPKKKTVEIILDTEIVPREFYTGICGFFDGKNLDTGVMIRFIHKKENKLFFHSGGGITHQSTCNKEYEELIEKVYLPLYL